ncbi:MAG: FAD-binding oxidoreductase [Solirubrobacterales bacterium]|nr:FAD-binding oxidoreductase [Solirubrobacterales bacterium]
MQSPTSSALVVTLPGDKGYAALSMPWNVAFTQAPAAIAAPTSVQEVVEAVRFARENDLTITVQGTGHNVAARSGRPLDQTLLLRTDALKGVEVDAERRRARIMAGALWAEVTEPAAEHGLAPLSGSSPDVGAVGMSLGGGVGWLVRKHGLSSESILAVELVTADGAVVRADAEQNPELFWALRGGGGNFGVVTAIEVQLHPVPELYAGWLVFPAERTAEVFTAWRAWTDTVPEEVTSTVRYLQLPPIPDIPEPMRGARIAVVEAAILASPERGAELIAPIRELGPIMDSFDAMPVSALVALHQDPVGPTPAYGHHRMLADVTPGTIAALMEVAGPDSGSPLLGLELRHLGGRVGRREPGHGALGALDAGFLLFGVGAVMDPALGEAVEARLTQLFEATAAWDAGKVYTNFVERPVDTAAVFDEVTYARLRAVKAQVDPGDVFRANLPIAPAS